MALKKQIRILVKGGILTPGYMLKILELAKKCNNEFIHFGSRQDVIFTAKNNQLNDIETSLNSAGIEFEYNEQGKIQHENIVSSYVSNGILKSTDWVNEGAYLRIFDRFRNLPKIRINIIDPKQNLIPLFNGLLNFIASEKEGYWFIYVNQGCNKEILKSPYIIHGDDIPTFCRGFEELFLNNKIKNIKQLFLMVKNTQKLKIIETTANPEIPKGFFPYYEGINRMDNTDNYWAGFYWRNNEYSIKFLEHVCKLCADTNIAKISITPWKTFLVKDIKKSDRILWERLIGRFGINMRHSSFELNWHLPLLNKSAFDLKKYIVKEFDKIDVRTYGLSFSIESSVIGNSLTSIKIVKKPSLFSFIKLFQKYSIEVAEDFNPNTNTYTTFARNLSKSDIPAELIELSRKYYNSLGDSRKIKEVKNEAVVRKQEVYQCKSCFTIYMSSMGDEFNSIPSGTLFVDLPENYTCYTCGANKRNFEKTEIDEQMLRVV